MDYPRTHQNFRVTFCDRVYLALRMSGYTSKYMKQDKFVVLSHTIPDQPNSSTVQMLGCFQLDRELQ